MSTLNTSFDTHYTDSDELFLFYLESLTNVSTDIFQDLFTIEITLPDIAFETSLALEGYNFTDADWHGLGEVDNSELPVEIHAIIARTGNSQLLPTRAPYCGEQEGHKPNLSITSMLTRRSNSRQML